MSVRHIFAATALVAAASQPAAAAVVLIGFTGDVVDNFTRDFATGTDTAFDGPTSVSGTIRIDTDRIEGTGSSAGYAYANGALPFLTVSLTFSGGTQPGPVLGGSIAEFDAIFGPPGEDGSFELTKDWVSLEQESGTPGAPVSDRNTSRFRFGTNEALGTITVDGVVLPDFAAANQLFFEAQDSRIRITNAGPSGTGTFSVGLIDPVTVTIEEAAAAVPEPATWGMMILGFGLVGAAARRRHSAATA